MKGYYNILQARMHYDTHPDMPSLSGNTTFGMAIEALKAGFPVKRACWGENMFVIKQIPAYITEEIIPKMQSLPEQAKKLILSKTKCIDYNQQCLLYDAASGKANSWAPTVGDMFANDWQAVYKKRLNQKTKTMKEKFKKWFGWMVESERPKHMMVGFCITVWVGLAAACTAGIAAEYKDWCYNGKKGGVQGFMQGNGFDWLDLAATVIGGLVGEYFHYSIFGHYW